MSKKINDPNEITNSKTMLRRLKKQQTWLYENGHDWQTPHYAAEFIKSQERELERYRSKLTDCHKCSGTGIRDYATGQSECSRCDGTGFKPK